MLREAGGIELAVRARTPREHMPFFAGGLLLALTAPLRDLGDDSVIGGVLQWVALLVPAAILVFYMRQSRQVRVRPRSPKWLWAALWAWSIAAGFVVPRVLDGTIGFAHTLGNGLAAVPLLLWAERLRRSA